ncbi:MAG TPA: hypothetical protein VIK78_19545 [Ruminiclostridium sp.]
MQIRYGGFTSWDGDILIKYLYYIMHTFTECRDLDYSKRGLAVCNKCGRKYFVFVK